MNTVAGVLPVSIGKTAYVLPEGRETNDDLQASQPSWRVKEIEKKTGVLTRFKVDRDVTAVDLAESAARKLFASGVDPATLGGVILVTQSPDYPLPSSACILQNRLELPKTCLAFDVNLGCSGFVYGLAVGGSLIHSRVVDNILLVCAETYSKYIQSDDRTCRPLFSDGASATLLQASPRGRLGPFILGTDGSGADNLIARWAPGSEAGDKAPKATLFMDGAKVFMFTMGQVPALVKALLEKAALQMADIDLFVFHQASKVVMDSVIEKLQLPADKVFLNYQRWGNTVSASLPMALQDAIDEGRVRSGSRVMVVGFGVGYSWGACVVEFP